MSIIQKIVAASISIALILFLMAFGSSEKNDNEAEESQNRRADLKQKLYSEGEVLLIYATGSSAEINKNYEETVMQIQESSRWIRYTPIADTAITSAEMLGKTIVLIGTAATNSQIRVLAEKLPIQLEANQFSIFGDKFSEKNDIFTFFYPNPFDQGHAIYIISGINDEKLLQLLNKKPRELLRISGDYRVLRGEKLVLMGFFDDTAAKWTFDANQHRNFLKEVKEVETTSFYKLTIHNNAIAEADATALVAEQENRLRKMLDFLELPKPDFLINLHIYATLEDKGLTTGNTSLSHISVEKNAVFIGMQPNLNGNTFFADAQLIARKMIGEPKISALETGLSAYFSEAWHRKGYQYWAAKLIASGNQAPLSDMLENDVFAKSSELVMTALSGSFVEFLIEKIGKTSFLQKYGSWQPNSLEIQQLEVEWHQYMQKQTKQFSAAFESIKRNFPQPPKFHKGFCFAHEGYQIYNGYISRQASEAIAKLANMNANTLSITPFSYMRNPNKPTFFYYANGARSAGSETDESVIHSALAAKSNNLSVMLKPHIWLGRSWPGDIEMSNEKDWEQFFDYYYRWMRHFALLAEMYEMEMLCVGVEMAKTTAAQENRWRELIAKLRKLYSGKMTYAANWGSDFENVPFWDDLDYMGLNCYYPLSEKDAPNDAELRKGVQKNAEIAARVHQKYNKPLILTEIGFTSTPAPWKNPHEVSGQKPVDLTAQARSYQIVFEEMVNVPWMNGFYWWKWPTYLEYGGKNDNDFTPNNKPAEDVVRRFYQRNHL